MKVRLLIWVSLLAFLVSCEQKSDIVIPTPAEKTVLVYFAADNNLAQYVQLDIDEMKQGMEEHPLSVSQHLLLYKDTGGEAQLIELVNRNGEVVEKVVKTYPDRNSVGVEEMSEVFNDVFNNPTYEAESYGLVYWSHGEGWIPYPQPSTRWIGQDNPSARVDNRMNLSEFKQVLDAAPHFDYILFDACFMQSIEVSYELHDYADYFIASPTETPATGAPYDAILPYMFGNGRAADLAKAYYETYAKVYDPDKDPQNDPWIMGASICAVESVGLEALASATREALLTLETSLDCSVLQGQAFDYDVRSIGHIGYYDLVDVMQALLTEGAYATWKQAYDTAVIYYNTTETNFTGYFQDDFSMTGTHGVTLYLPSAPGVEACEAYHTLDWYDAAGISALGW